MAKSSKSLVDRVIDLEQQVADLQRHRHASVNSMLSNVGPNRIPFRRCRRFVPCRARAQRISNGLMVSHIVRVVRAPILMDPLDLG